jgi:hypothetical protein
MKGRRAISKVDDKGKTIKISLSLWKAKHPGKLHFDSMLEYDVYTVIRDSGLDFVYQPSIELFPSMEVKEMVKGVIKKKKQQNISYTPDFYLSKYGAYVEVKGYADELFKLRWKLFKLKGYVGYLVYTVTDIVNLLDLLEQSYES